MWQSILVCRPFCYKTCTRILRVQPRLQMGQVSIIENSFPQERSQKLKPPYIAAGLCYTLKKINVFFKIYIVCFPSLVGWYSIRAFLKTTWRICPIQLGHKIFCISLCQKGAVLCGGEMTFCPEHISLICFSSFFFVLFLFFLYTDKNDYFQQQLTSSGIHMNEQEWERHIKQNKIRERLLLSCTSTYFFGEVAQ